VIRLGVGPKKEKKKKTARWAGNWGGKKKKHAAIVKQKKKKQIEDEIWKKGATSCSGHWRNLHKKEKRGGQTL